MRAAPPAPRSDLRASSGSGGASDGAEQESAWEKITDWLWPDDEPIYKRPGLYVGGLITLGVGWMIFGGRAEEREESSSTEEEEE